MMNTILLIIINFQFVAKNTGLYIMNSIDDFIRKCSYDKQPTDFDVHEVGCSVGCWC